MDQFFHGHAILLAEPQPRQGKPDFRVSLESNDHLTAHPVLHRLFHQKEFRSFFPREPQHPLLLSVEQVYANGQKEILTTGVSTSKRTFPVKFTITKSNGQVRLDFTQVHTGHPFSEVEQASLAQLAGFFFKDYFYYKISPDWEILEVSPSVQDILGYTPDEFKGPAIQWLGNPSAKAQLEGIRSWLLEGKQPPLYEIQLMHKQGHMVWVEVLEHPVSDDKGKVKYAEGVVREIKARKLKEQELLKNKNLLEEAFKSGNLAYWEVNFKDDTLSLSPENESILPITLSHPAIMKVEEWMQTFLKKEDQKKFSAFFEKEKQRSPQSKSTQVLDLPIMHNGKPSVILRISGRKMGRHRGIWLIQDISERKRVQRQIQINENRLNNIINNATDMILSLDQKGKITNFNASAQDFAKATIGREIKTGEKFTRLIPSDRLQTLATRLFKKSLQGEEQRFTDKIRVTKYRSIYLDAKFTPIITQQEGIEGVVIFAKDITQRKLSELRLQDSEAKLKSIINNTSDFILSINRNFRITAFNEPLARDVLHYFGFQLKEGMDLTELVSVQYRKKIAEIFQRVLEGRKMVDVNRFVLPDGEHRVHEIHFNPIYNSQGEIEGISCFTKNITEQQEAEEKILNISRELKDSQEIARLGYWHYDLHESRITYWSDLTYPQYDFDPGEATPSYLDFLNKIYPDDLAEINRKLNQSIKQAQPIQVEFRTVHRDGQVKWLNIKTEFQKDDAGKPAKMICISQDITERRTIEEEIKESEKNLSALINNTTDFIYSIDNQYRIKTLNKPFVSFFHKVYGIHIAVGDQILNKLPERLQEQWKLQFDQALTGEAYTTEETLVNMTFETSYNPITGDFGDIIGVAVMSRDITERKQYETEIEQQNRELIKVNKELDRFVYSVSHDLRAPLTSSMGLIKIIRNEKEERIRENYIGMLLHSLEKLDSFILDIMDISKNARLEVEPEAVDLKSLIESVLEEQKFISNYDQIDKKVDVSLAKPFYTDRKRLLVILKNVLSNAIRYAVPHRRQSFVKVTAEEKDKQVLLCIKDNGQGIATEHLNRIFDMFYRAASNQTGSGLGLYIVKEAVEKLGGEVRVQSQLGEGTTFTLQLPNLKGQSRSKIVQPGA